MEIQLVTAEAFKKYGRVVTDVDCTSLLEKMEETPCPQERTCYVASDEALEALEVASTIQNYFYGGLPTQIGYCNGHNQKLNGLEYHRNSEIDIAVTDLILLVGMQQDIAEDGTYETEKVEAFLVPAKTAVELYATTLHFAPCGVDGAGFRCVVVLPKGTNTPIDFEYDKTTVEGARFRLRNKWLITHKDANIEGAFVGLVGENHQV